MSQGHALTVVSALAAPNLGVFRGRDVVARGVTRKRWSVPGHGYRLVFATWAKVTSRAEQLLNELAATLAA